MNIAWILLLRIQHFSSPDFKALLISDLNTKENIINEFILMDDKDIPGLHHHPGYWDIFLSSWPRESLILIYF